MDGKVVQKCYLLALFTVMLTKRAPVGCVAMNAIPMATNQGFLNFQCGPLLRPLYLAFWLRTNRPYLEMVANGSTYPELYKSDLFEFEIAVPPVQEQDAIIDLARKTQVLPALGYKGFPRFSRFRRTCVLSGFVL